MGCDQNERQFFKHSPLQNPWQICLIEVLPRADSDPIKVNIRFVPRGDAKQVDPDYDGKEDANKIAYNALSYTWGDLREAQQILMDDAPFLVAPNLYAFLWRQSYTMINLHITSGLMPSVLTKKIPRNAIIRPNR